MKNNMISKIKTPLTGHQCPQLRKQHQFLEMPLEEASSLMLSDLPLFHKDPFDRLLICQALSHGLTLITDDILILKYDVPTL
jgi:PIN domain nuclease of toxin-antitoxin system